MLDWTNNEYFKYFWLQNPESTLSSSPRTHRKDRKPAPSGDSPLKSDTCLDLSDSATDAQKVLSQDDSDIKLPTTRKNVRLSTPRKRFLGMHSNTLVFDLVNNIADSFIHFCIGPRFHIVHIVNHWELYIVLAVNELVNE